MNGYCFQVAILHIESIDLSINNYTYVSTRTQCLRLYLPVL
jgi:hypothetical protein